MWTCALLQSLLAAAAGRFLMIQFTLQSCSEPLLPHLSHMWLVIGISLCHDCGAGIGIKSYSAEKNKLGLTSPELTLILLLYFLPLTCRA